MNILSGYKTYIGAAGIFGLAIYYLSQGDYPNFFAGLGAGLATVGLRHAIAKVEPPPKLPGSP